MQELQKNIDKYLDSHLHDQKLIEELNESKKKDSTKFNYKLSFIDFNQDFSILDSRFIDNGPSNWQVIDSELLNNPNSRVIEESGLSINLSLMKDMKSLLRLPPATEIILNNMISLDKSTTITVEVYFEIDPAKDYIVSFTAILSENIQLVIELNRKLKKIRLLLIEEETTQIKIVAESLMSCLKENSRNRLLINLNIQLLALNINDFSVYSGDILMSLSKLETMKFKIGVLDAAKFEIFDLRIWGDQIMIDTNLNKSSIQQTQSKFSNQIENKQIIKPTSNEINQQTSNTIKPEANYETFQNSVESSFIITQCNLLRKDPNLCSYLTRIAKRHNIDLSTDKSYPGLISKMKESCLQKLRSDVVCNKIVKAAAELVEEIKANIQKKNTKIKQNIFENIISACNPQESNNSYPKSRALCLDNSLKLIVSQRFSKFQHNDCTMLYCKECCSMNYGNQVCELCKSQHEN